MIFAKAVKIAAVYKENQQILNLEILYRHINTIWLFICDMQYILNANSILTLAL